MPNKLQQYFPLIQNRSEILAEINSKEYLSDIFNSWDRTHQEDFLDFCSGAKGVKTLYDGFAKEILNPETHPERLNDLISLILKKKTTILQILPNDNSRIADESSLLLMDIVVKLEDGSIANVEIQKTGYHFPGQRCACYSCDLLLRQYKSIHSQKTKENFSYRDLKNVYTIVFFEHSTKEFHEFENTWCHHFQQKSDTGLQLNLLQHYFLIPLDIFLKFHQNNDIHNRFEAWLTFLSSDDPDDIVAVVENYPQFKAMYEQIYDICRNMERVMEMFSEELLEMDRNTVRYMIDEMQATIDQQKESLEEKDSQLKQMDAQLGQKDAQLEQKNLLLQKALLRIS